MKKHRQADVSLISPGELVEALHYGPYSRYWWHFLSDLNKDSNETVYLPIRVQQKSKIILNEHEFIVTIVAGNKENNNFLPGYLCQSENIVEIANDPTNAISEVYFKIFETKTRYSGVQIMGWNDENIIKELCKDVFFVPRLISLEQIKIFVYGVGYSSRTDWFYAGPGYKSSLLYNKYRGNTMALFISKIEETKCILEIHQNQKCKRIIEGESPIDQESPLIELNNELQEIYPVDYQFSSRELGAWKTFLRAAGAHDVTPWTHETSQYQFWSKSSCPKQDYALLTQLYQMGILVENSTQTFWQCFNHTLKDNKKNFDGKRRILSIIADDFTYDELQENLGVGRHTILESRKYTRTNGYGAPVLNKPTFHRTKFVPEQLKQFELFFSTKEHVNMSSYKTDNKSGLPVLYLQDHKQALWNQFHEKYPNGMKRTSFMTQLNGKRFVYKENLGGLCSECNECGYQVFANIEELVNINITNLLLRNELIGVAQNLRCYLRRDYPKQLNVSQNGIAVHNSCLSHCLRHAFGDCEEIHSNTCINCKNLFIFFENLKKHLPLDQHENLDGYQKQLIAFMSHHARKIYLNAQLPAILSQLDDDEALMIVDYKMRINPKKARETKDEWFGKRGWTLHTVLLYTKEQNTDNLNINAYDHWSGDTKQDAWFTASSLHGVLETLEKKPKYITIISDNGGHYHNTELMIILSHWKEWYDVYINKWIFLEAGGGKSTIDSHHAQITHAIKRYVKLGYEIASGEDIEMAIKGLFGTHVANLQQKQKIGTITGIRNWNEFTWVYDGEEAGYIYARPLPKFGELNKFSPNKIQKIVKNRIIVKPDPIISEHSNPQKSWNIPKIDHQDTDTIESLENQMNELVS
ncbi:hypothetical protein RirG_189890 [Rhizophagus irregularis DAOM 197198w]|uniref:C2H2-type domain-containing protein n=1 Tax=Rhizophagus irregularis (strain DAOM 197198w) TaxID=1432141 RepID=A0A015LXF5_RHIIW|nr:hypothetical protein RirG_189890 [Rhizophagus irregularis DAOM 197198w]